MPLELLTTRGRDAMACRDAGLCRIGEALAELMARYEFDVESDAAEMDGWVGEADFVSARCDAVGCAGS
jgi:hypothetical protein